MKKIIGAAVLSIAGMVCAQAQSLAAKDSVIATPTTSSITASDTKPAETKKKNWYEVISLRGYAQFRYNRLLETNSDLKCDQCDKSIGNNGGFFFRRARLVFSGNIHERVFIYIQTDVATNATAGSTLGLNYLQIRDFYGDIYLTKDRKLRARVGISKVPFGFENLQSSQNRVAFDRTDGMNSSVYNERDLGVFFYFTPDKIKERFKYLVDSGLKGTGDYGVFGFGMYNGQTANRSELNNSLHTVMRATYPFQVNEKQILELGIQGYSGLFHVGEAVSPANVALEGNNQDYTDQRVAASVTLYPQPFGVQAEYMYGRGPVYQYNGPMAAVMHEIITGRNEGGYLQLMYMRKIKNMTVTPYTRGQYFFGGKKPELDARRHIVKELEMGIEFQIIKQLEVTLAYTISDRVFEDSRNPVNHQKGNFMRMQLQLNF
jgi:hypothetical protein